MHGRFVKIASKKQGDEAGSIGDGDRRKCERAFFYLPRFTRTEWERMKAGDMLAGFLGGSQPSSEMLISCLVDAVSEHDEALLDELERKIRLKREQLSRKGEM